MGRKALRDLSKSNAADLVTLPDKKSGCPTCGRHFDRRYWHTQFNASRGRLRWKSNCDFCEQTRKAKFKQKNPTYFAEKKRAYRKRDRAILGDRRIVKPGEAHFKAKLTERQVLLIRALRAKGWYIREIYDLLDHLVTQANLQLIVRGKTWKHLM